MPVPELGAWWSAATLGNLLTLGGGDAASILEKMLRPIIVYASLVAGLRIFGKRELAHLNPVDMVVLFTLSNTVQNAIIGNDNSLSGGLLGIATMLVLNYVTVKFSYHHTSFAHLIEGSPVDLVLDGQLRDQALREELIPRAELEAAANRQGLDLNEVDHARLHPGGTLTFKAKTTPDRTGEVLKRLDLLAGEVASLRAALDRR